MQLEGQANAQIDRFEIDYPHDQSVDAFGLDSLGYPWTLDIDNGELEVIKYYGNRLFKSYFPKKLAGNYSGQVIFLGDQLLIGNENMLYLFDPSDQMYEVLWELPSGYRYDYSYQDDQGTIWVFITDSTSEVCQLFHYTVEGNFELAFELKDAYNDLRRHFNYGINDIDGQLIFLYEDHGFHMLNGKGESMPLDLTDQDDLDEKYTCSVFKLDNRNDLWRVYEDEVELLNKDTKRFEWHPISELVNLRNPCMEYNKSLRLRSIFRDSKGRLWLAGEDSHLYLYEELTDQLTFFGKELVDNLGGQAGDIINLLEDNSGNIWGRKRGGIFKISEKKELFERYVVNTQNENHPIYEDRPHINRTLDRYGKFGKKATVVASVEEDAEHNILFTDQRFLFKLDAHSKAVKILPTETESSNINFFQNDSLRFLSIWNSVYSLDGEYTVKEKLYEFKRLKSVFQHSNGTLWFSGVRDEDYNGLFAKIDPSTLLYSGEFTDSKGNTFSDRGTASSITEDKKGNLWLTRWDGIFKIEAHTELIIPQESKARYEDKIISLKVDHLANVRHIEGDYLGLKLEDGLAVINAETYEIKSYVALDELGLKSASAVYIDLHSAWYGDGKRLSNYNFETKEIMHFSSSSGLDVGERVLNFKKLQNGKIAMGTFNGLYLFHPDSLTMRHNEIIQNEKDVLVRLESYSILDGVSDSLHTSNYLVGTIKKPIEFGHNDRMLKLQFSMSNFDNSEEHQYAHWLEGYDKTWNAPVADNIITYTSLPAGKYTLKVRAHPGNGTWSTSTVEIPILVYPPWYKRWWSYLTFAIIVFGTVYGIHRYQINQLLKYQSLRTKISSDLHDDVGTLLSSLAMQSDVLSIGAPPDKVDRFKKFSSLSREAMDRMRDTVWSIDSRKDNMVSLIDRIGDYAAEMGEGQHIHIKFEHEVAKLSGFLRPDTRQNVYLICKEAVNNAIKHTNGNRVVIKLHQTSKTLLLSIKDNGTKSTAKTSGLGISNMQMRANRINGLLTINTDHGFEILLRIDQ